VSVATADITNMRMNVMMISNISDCALLPAGRLAPSLASLFKMRRNTKADAIAPVIWAPKYAGTWLIAHKKQKCSNYLISLMEWNNTIINYST
jgi:hypothetical protein